MTKPTKQLLTTLSAHTFDTWGTHMEFRDAYEITVTDMLNGPDGWTENGCWVDRITIYVPESASDLALARRVLKAAGYSGEISEKLGDLWWRCGTVSVRADYLHETVY